MKYAHRFESTVACSRTRSSSDRSKSLSCLPRQTSTLSSTLPCRDLSNSTRLNRTAPGFSSKPHAALSRPPPRSPMATFRRVRINHDHPSHLTIISMALKPASLISVSAQFCDPHLVVRLSQHITRSPSASPAHQSPPRQPAGLSLRISSAGL